MKAKYQKINQEVEVSNKVEAAATKVGSLIGSLLNGVVRGTVAIGSGLASGVSDVTPDVDWTAVGSTIATADLIAIDAYTGIVAASKGARAKHNMDTVETVIQVKSMTQKLTDFNETAKAMKNLHQYDTRTQERIIADYNQLKKELNS